MLLFAVYQVLLYRYTGQEDIIVGTPVAGRPQLAMQKIAGVFVNTLAVRNYPAGVKRFKDFLKEVKANILETFANEEYQFENLVNQLNIPRDVSRNPLFDVLFSLEEETFTDLQLEGLEISPYRTDENVAKFDISLITEQKKELIQCNFEYRTDLFKEETIRALGEHFVNILKSVIKDDEKH